MGFVNVTRGCRFDFGGVLVSSWLGFHAQLPEEVDGEITNALCRGEAGLGSVEPEPLGLQRAGETLALLVKGI